MPIIREFRNTDIEQLCAVWNEHFADQGPSCEMTPLRLELYALSKPYFARDELLVCESESGVLLGLLHFGPTGTRDSTDTSQETVAIFALCLRSESSDEVAMLLLDAFQKRAQAKGFVRCVVRPGPKDAGYYLSLGPADNLIGATAEEVRLCNLLASQGYSPKAPTCLWELELAFFTPPMDRAQIQIRRSCQVQHSGDEPSLPWWQACLMGHTDPSLITLQRRQDQSVLSAALFWTISPELGGPSDPLAGQIAWLWNLEVPEEQPDIDALTFLLSESMRLYQSEGVSAIRTATKLDASSSAEILHRLGFAPIFNGMTFEKTF